MTGTLKILMILTSQATMGAGGPPTGVWFEEVSAPYYTFVDSGAEVDIASPLGGRIPVDPHSLRPAGSNPASVERFLKDAVAMGKFESSWKIDAVSPSGYNAIFLPGGHGTMWDLASNERLGQLLSAAWADQKVIAAVCHGPAGLVNAKDADGKPLVSGRRVSAFTNSEEHAAGLDHTVPFLLESRIRELGANYERGADFASFAVRDGNLVTGQNPASSEAVARLTLEAARKD